MLYMQLHDIHVTVVFLSIHACQNLWLTWIAQIYRCHEWAFPIVSNGKTNHKIKFRQDGFSFDRKEVFILLLRQGRAGVGIKGHLPESS